MKKILVILVVLIGFGISAFAIPEGQYCTLNPNENSDVIVSDNQIHLYIDNNYITTFEIQEEQEDGTFTYIAKDGKLRKGSWYQKDGNIYLNLGGQRLQKCS